MRKVVWLALLALVTLTALADPPASQPQPLSPPASASQPLSPSVPQVPGWARVTADRLPDIVGLSLRWPN